MSNQKITDWYRKKVDRINRVPGVKIENIATKSVGVLVNEKELNHYSNQVMVTTTITLLSKWCTDIHVLLSKDIELIIPGLGGKRIKNYLKDLIEANDDEILFQFHEELNFEADIFLSIGDPSFDHSHLLWIDSNGWIAGVGAGKESYQSISKVSGINPLGSVFSACLAQSLIFSTLLGLEENLSFSKWISLFDYSETVDKIQLLPNPTLFEEHNFGKVFQVGCGAVGSSFDFILSLTKFTGVFTLIDYDAAQPENLPSSLAFTKTDTVTDIKKVEICNRILRSSFVTPIPYDGDYSSFIKSNKLSENYPDLILCFANEMNIWSTIQNNFPPIVLHATTTQNWGINFGRHFPLKDWCIVCRFGIQQSQIKQRCALGVIKQNESEKESEKEILGVLPFLSPAAAVITLAELIKLNAYKQRSEFNFTQVVLKSIRLMRFKLQQRAKIDDCAVCSHQDEEIYSNYLTRSKYLQKE